MNWRPPLLLLEPCPGSLSRADLISQRAPLFACKSLCACVHMNSRMGQNMPCSSLGPSLECRCSCTCVHLHLQAPGTGNRIGADQHRAQGDTEHRMHTGHTKVAAHRRHTGFSNVAAHQKRTGWAKCRSSPDAHRFTKWCRSPLRVPTVHTASTARMPVCPSSQTSDSLSTVLRAHIGSAMRTSRQDTPHNCFQTCRIVTSQRLVIVLGKAVSP